MLLKHQEKSGMEMSPEYRKALQDLIKCEIRALTQRLAETGEECLVLTASIQDKSFSQFGSKKGEGFLGEKVHIQEQFLDFCAKVPDSLILQTQDDSTAHVAADVDETDQSLRPVALYRNYLPATEVDKDGDRINREHLTQRASPPPPIYSSSKPHLPSGSQDQPILHTRNNAGIKKPQETRLHNQDLYNADKLLQNASREKFDRTKSKKVNNTIFLTAEYFEKDRSASMLGKLSKDGAFVDLSHCGTEHFVSDVHMNRHQCSLCGKVFRQREGLKLHMRIHTGERPYICEFCGKIFSRKFVYTVHLRVHSGVRPYMCDICQKSFMYKTSWFRHKKQKSCYYYGKKETGLKVHVSNDKDQKEELKDQSGIMDWTEVENGHPIIHALGDEIANQLDTVSKNIATGEKEILRIDQHQFGLFTEKGKGNDSLDKNLINQNLGIAHLDHNQKAFQIPLGLQNKNSGEMAEIQNLAKLWKMCSTIGSQVTSTQSNDVNIFGGSRRLSDQEEIVEQSWIEEQNTAQRETIRLKNSDGLGGDIIKIEVEEGIREDCVVIEDSDSQEVKMENVELPIREKSQENNLRNSENNEINSFLDCYSAKQTIERSGRASVSLKKYPKSLEESNRQSFPHDEHNTAMPLYPVTFSEHSLKSKTTREFDQHQFSTVGLSSSKGEVVRLDFSGELSSQSQNGNFSRGDFENRRNNSKSENSCQSLNTMPSSESTAIRHISRNTHSQNTSQTNSLNAQNLIKVDTDPKNPGQRIYICILCGYGSMRKCDVEKHTRTHTGERPYCCQVCGKAFVSCSAYNVHCRIHSGVKPYKCDLCSKAFVDRSAQLRHLRCFHGLKPYKCPECPQMFNTKAECDTHHFTHATN
ncbi:hypothetical protein ACJMK2_034509 [Sinanodonta woodiana]|uniref:C2H2-type domain-containing protein n=1 Tax=Sinanodonta woodiana TaxID=1069815 RepID=A0ABD3WRV1_SINWO